MFKGVCLSVFVVVVSNSSLLCIGKAVSPFHYVFYCTGVEEGDVGDDWKLVMDIDLAELGASYLYVQLHNIGDYSLDFELRRLIPLEGVKEGLEKKDSIAAKDFYEIELTRPLHWKLYVKNTTTGQTTKYKIFVRVVK